MRWAVAFGCGVALFAFSVLFREQLAWWGVIATTSGAFALGLTRPRPVYWLIGIGLAMGLLALAVGVRAIGIAPLASLPLVFVATHALLGCPTRSVRAGSLTAAAQFRQIAFRTAAIVYAVALLAAVTPRRPLAELVLVLSFVAMAALWSVATSRVAELIDLGARMRPLDAGMPRAGLRDIDVGAGDQVHLVDGKGGAAYRGTMVGSATVTGDLHGLTRRLAGQVRTGGVCVAISLAAMVGVTRSTPDRQPPFHHPPLSPREVGEEPGAPALPSVKSLGWYPQDEPILVDINGDGVDDIIGLRWDWSSQAAPLVLVANDGQTFARVWQTVGFPAQWASPHTRLLLSGQNLYMTDSEAELRVFDLRTGNLRSGAAWKLVERACVSQSGDVWLQAEDDAYEQGWLVGADLSKKAGKRPAWCTPELPTCGKNSGDGLCAPGPTPPFVSRERSFVTLTQTATHGVAVVGKAKAGREAEAVIAYDPRTLVQRWERPLALDDEPLHASPGISHQQEGNVLYVKYQLRNGSWVFGARDLDTGAVLWSQNPPNAAIGSHVPSMFVKATRLYVRVDSELVVIDGKTGKRLGTAR